MNDYGGYVIVHHTTDPAQGEMLAELLRNEGIEARFRGAASTLIGIAKDMASMAVEVPAEQEERAREFLRALEDTAVAADSSEQDVPPPPAPPPRVRGQEGRPQGRPRTGLVLTIAAALALLGLTLVLYNLR